MTSPTQPQPCPICGGALACFPNEPPHHAPLGECEARAARKAGEVVVPKRYRTIVVDPPWSYPDGFAGTSATGSDRRRGGVVTVKSALPYTAMATDDIAALPIASWADQHSRLFLWTTNRYLPSAFTIIGRWGFTYRQTLIWHKPDGFFGGSLAPNAEFLLVAIRGTPARLARIPNAVISHAQRQLAHSQKPECFYDHIELTSPGPYLDVFARRLRLGWDCWGNETYNVPGLPAVGVEP